LPSDGWVERKTLQDGVAPHHCRVLGFSAFESDLTRRNPVLAESKSCFWHGVNRAGAKFFAFISHSILTSYDLNEKKVKFSACV